MLATVQFVRTTFDRFNALCFEGVLPAVPIVLTKAGTFLGKMEYKSRRDFFGIISSHYDFRLKISTGFDLPQEELEDVVITVRYHVDPKQNLVRDGSARCRKHYLCVSTFSNGNKGITVCASTKIFELYRLLPKYYRISKMDLRDSIPLKCDGHTIGPM